MSRIALPCGLLLLLLAPTPAQAMRISTSVRLLAWSANGASVLLEENRSGPEGGGAMAYILLTSKPARVVRAVVSSDFSPGDGSTPQGIPARGCKQALSRLAAGIKRSGIKGVTLRPGRCNKKRRWGLLELAKSTQAKAAASLLGQGGRVIVDGSAELWLHKGKVLAGSPVRKAQKPADAASLMVYRAKKSKVLLVLHKPEYGDTLLGGLYVPSTKARVGFRKVKLPRSKGGF